jgi:hypothetical protein
LLIPGNKKTNELILIYISIKYFQYSKLFNKKLQKNEKRFSSGSPKIKPTVLIITTNVDVEKQSLNDEKIPIISNKDAKQTKKQANATANVQQRVRLKTKAKLNIKALRLVRWFNNFALLRFRAKTTGQANQLKNICQHC